MGTGEGLRLRKRALESLEKSTKMLQMAFDLVKQGYQIEAQRVREEARAQRTISTLLMAKANKLEHTPDSTQSPSQPDAVIERAQLISN